MLKHHSESMLNITQLSSGFFFSLIEIAGEAQKSIMPRDKGTEWFMQALTPSLFSNLPCIWSMQLPCEYIEFT